MPTVMVYTFGGFIGRAPNCLKAQWLAVATLVATECRGPRHLACIQRQRDVQGSQSDGNKLLKDACPARGGEKVWKSGTLEASVALEAQGAKRYLALGQLGYCRREHRVDPQLVGGLDHDADIVTQNLCQHLVDLCDRSLRPDCGAKLRLDHGERCFHVGPFVVVL